MSESFNIEIISPEKKLLVEKINSATVPSFEGDMTILSNHIPIITFLRPGLIIIKENGTEKIFFTEDGTVEFSNNKLLILTSTARSLDTLDKNSINTIIQNSETKLKKDEISDKERYLLSYKINTLKEINK